MKKTLSASNMRLVLGTALLVIAPWDGGGLRAATLPFYSVAASVLLALLLYSLVQEIRAKQRPSALLGLLGLAGGLFLAYLGLQWWNAGRMLYFDVGVYQWRYTLPRHPNLPFAYDRGDAKELLMWFFPAWVVALCLCHQARQNPRPLRVVLDILVLQAGLMALLGIFQFLVKSPALAWFWSGSRPGFASFGYANHAAAYFCMMGAIAIGLLYRTLFRADSPAHYLRVWATGLAALLCLVAACLTISRAGLLMTILITLFAMAYGYRKGWPRMRPAMRLNVCAATLALLAIATFLVAGFAGDAIQSRFRPRPTRQLTHTEQTASRSASGLSLGVRLDLWKYGWEVFQANRWFGNGPWGFKYELAHHVSPEDWPRLVEQEGRANVHNDPIQFLSEFGLVGSALLLATLACLLVPLFSKSMIYGSLFWMTLAGLGTVGIISIVDLPFRAPSILWTWIALLAMLPGLSSTQTPSTTTPTLATKPKS